MEEVWSSFETERVHVDGINPRPPRRKGLRRSYHGWYLFTFADRHRTCSSCLCSIFRFLQSWGYTTSTFQDKWWPEILMSDLQWRRGIYRPFVSETSSLEIYCTHTQCRLIPVQKVFPVFDSPRGEGFWDRSPSPRCMGRRVKLWMQGGRECPQYLR